MNKIRIVAAILDTEKLVLYKDDGLTVEVKQGDPRVQRIIDQVTEPLSTQGWAEVSLEIIDPDMNVYREFETLVKGAIRFFRVHKDKLSALFDQLVEEPADNGQYGTDRHLKPVSLGKVPGAPGSMNQEEVASQEELVSAIAPIAEAVSELDEGPTASQVADATANEKPSIQEATRQIMASAQSVSDPSFVSAETVEHRDTMIAAVEDEATGEITIVPGMENLQAQFAHAVKLGSTKGAENFVRRLAAVINQRKHTIDELLNFMSKGDLPIADDGSILAYKVLTTGHGEKKGWFVDCHSKSVQQRVGSFVTQANVDENRRVECSVGLHIARRGYLRSFPGNVIVLVKVAPEDVIAVPLNEPNKMRARGYHIVSEVPTDEHDVLRNNRPLEGTKAKKLLAMAIAGDHIDVIEEVIIGGPKGTEVRAVARPTEEVKIAKPPKPRKKTAEAQPLPDEAEKQVAPPVDVKTTSNRVLGVKVSEQRKLFEARDWTGLYAFKKAKKKGWDKLGFTSEEEKQIADNNPANAIVTEADRKNAAKGKVDNEGEAAERDRAKNKIARTGVPAAPAPASVPDAPANESRSDKARRLFKAKDWTGLYAHKKSVKVGWEKLGFSGQEIERIVKNEPKK